MEKYSRLSEITNQYLHGHLARLQMSYDNDGSISLQFLYEDDNHYWFDYELSFDQERKEVDHASHFSEGYLNKVTLNREKDFELAVMNVLLKRI